MTREEARKAAEVMLAYANGEDIEILGLDGKYKSEEIPYFNWGTKKYRIKSKQTYRPFKDKDECWNEMLKHQPFGWIKDAGKHINIIGLSETNVELSPDEVDMDFDLTKNYISFNYMFQSFTFADGTPFGIKED